MQTEKEQAEAVLALLEENAFLGKIFSQYTEEVLDAWRGAGSLEQRERLHSGLRAVESFRELINVRASDIVARDGGGEPEQYATGGDDGGTDATGEGARDGSDGGELTGDELTGDEKK